MQVAVVLDSHGHSSQRAASSTLRQHEEVGGCQQGSCAAACSRVVPADINLDETHASLVEGISVFSCTSEQPTDSCRQIAETAEQESAAFCGCTVQPSGATGMPDEEALFDMSPEWRRALQSLASVPGLNVFGCNASSRRLEAQ